MKSVRAMKPEDEQGQGPDRSDLYRRIPAVHELLSLPAFVELAALHSRSAVLQAARSALEDMRRHIASQTLSESELDTRIEALPGVIRTRARHPPNARAAHRFLS